MSNPNLDEGDRSALVDRLMHARRDVGLGLRAGDKDAVRVARSGVDEAKRALGERGPVWWNDGAPDLNSHMVANTFYASWYAGLDLTDDD